MKEMTYKKEKEYLKDVLDWGVWHNYEYVILNLYTHPTAYICLTSDDIFCNKHYDDIPIDVHGGLTFAEPTLYRIKEYSKKYKCNVNTSINRDWIIGWDYNHYGDYNSNNSMYGHSGRKYTTEEILEDCKQVIKQLIICNLKQAIINRLHEEAYEDEWGRHIPSLKELDDITGQVIIHGKKIEEMKDDDYYYYLKILKEELMTDETYMQKIENLIWDFEHPYNDWDNCDADFYGV